MGDWAKGDWRMTRRAEREGRTEKKKMITYRARHETHFGLKFWKLKNLNEPYLSKNFVLFSVNQYIYIYNFLDIQLNDKSHLDECKVVQ